MTQLTPIVLQCHRCGWLSSIRRTELVRISKKTKINKLRMNFVLYAQTRKIDNLRAVAFSRLDRDRNFELLKKKNNR